jgi:Uma2 family endonuclease
MGVTSALPLSRPLTYDDLQAMPDDDGHRYELIDGVLIVTPAPMTRHQVAVGNLHLALRESCPAVLAVFLAPFDVVLSDTTVLQPDLVVARRSDVTERNLPAPPVLAVEILSPSTRRIDLGTKLLALEDAGVPTYWVVDPDEPSLTVFELDGATYRQVGRVVGDEAWETTRPHPVRIVPALLVAS